MKIIYSWYEQITGVCWNTWDSLETEIMVKVMTVKIQMNDTEVETEMTIKDITVKIQMNGTEMNGSMFACFV